ncbi:hypothetical protein D9M71_413690 [compost metagenome]
MALASSNSPTSGSSKWPKAEVRKLRPNSQLPRPVRPAIVTPAPAMRWYFRFIRCSTQAMPLAMYCSTSATAVIRPAMKPPPGRLCPRRKMNTETSRASGNSTLERVARIG